MEESSTLAKKSESALKYSIETILYPMKENNTGELDITN
jgi:hypothetical protein